MLLEKVGMTQILVKVMIGENSFYLARLRQWFTRYLVLWLQKKSRLSPQKALPKQYCGSDCSKSHGPGHELPGAPHPASGYARKLQTSETAALSQADWPHSGPRSLLTLHMVCLMAKPKLQLESCSKGKGNVALPPGTALQWKRCLHENGIFGQAPDQQGRGN